MRPISRLSSKNELLIPCRILVHQNYISPPIQIPMPTHKRKSVVLSKMSEESAETGRIDRETENKVRREARQRKILENAKSRLEKLNGRATHPDGDIRPQQIIYPDPEVEQELFDNLAANESSHHFMAAPSARDRNVNTFDLNSTENIFELLGQFTQAQNHNNAAQQANWAGTSATPPPPDAILTKFIKTKVHIALISIITYCLFVTGNELYISYSVFFPLLVWEIVELFMIRSRETSSSFFIQILVMLTAIPPHHLVAITKAVNTLNKIFKDVGVFVFFFAIYNLFYRTFLRTAAFDGVGASLRVDL